MHKQAKTQNIPSTLQDQVTHLQHRHTGTTHMELIGSTQVIFPQGYVYAMWVCIYVRACVYQSSPGLNFKIQLQKHQATQSTDRCCCRCHPCQHTCTHVHTQMLKTKSGTFHTCACNNTNLHIHKIPVSVTHTRFVI